MSLISAAIGSVWSLPGETQIILWLQSLGGKGSFLYYLMNFVTMFGEEILLVGILGLVYWGFDKHRGEQIGFFLITATIVNPMIKNVVCRTRPFDSSPAIQNFRDVEGYSFPSGHSANAASTYIGTAYVYRDKRFKWLVAFAVVLPILVAISRLYLGAHYPTDVIFGLTIGVFIVVVVGALRNVVNKYWLYLGLAVIGLGGFFYCTTEDFFTAYGLLLGFGTGVFFEEKVVNFQNTRVWWRILLRVVGGGAIFLGANELLKMLMGVIYPGYEQDVWFEHAFRVLRYATIIFVDIGVYPMLFAQTEKLWKKLGWIKSSTPQEEQTNG